MPGFFDVIFGSSPAEPAEPKPKKVKKVKDDNTLIKKLEAEIIELKEKINKPKPESEPALSEDGLNDLFDKFLNSLNLEDESDYEIAERMEQFKESMVKSGESENDSDA